MRRYSQFHVLAVLALMLFFAQAYGAQVFTDEEKADSYNQQDVDTPPKSVQQEPAKVPYDLKGDRKSVV